MSEETHMYNDIHYLPPRSELWSGRDDGPDNLRNHQTVELVNLRTALPKTSKALLGFCCDAGVKRNMGRLGALEGPEMFRRSLAKLPSSAPFEDCGDIVCIGDELENCQNAFASGIAAIPKGTVVFGIGGGHEIAWAHYSGLKQIHEEPIGIINIDAHFDLRPLIAESRGTSGTSFLQIAHHYPFDYTVIGIQKMGNTQGLFNKAEELKSKVITAEEIHLNGIDSAMTAIDASLKRNSKIYLSICLDVFAAPYAPGVSAPQPLGLLPWHVIPLLQKVWASGKVVGVDIAELNPHYDRDDMTALLAASLAAYMLEP